MPPYHSFSRPVVLNLESPPTSPGGLLNTKIAGSLPPTSDSVGLRFDSRTCTFNKFPDEAHAAGPGATLDEPLPSALFKRGSGRS